MNEKMVEEIALNYFRRLNKQKKKKLLKKIVNLLNEEEKVELAKILIKNKTN